MVQIAPTSYLHLHTSLQHVCAMSEEYIREFLREMKRLANENADTFDAASDIGGLLALANRTDLLLALWRDPETLYGIRLAYLKGKDWLTPDGLRDVRTSAVWCTGREMADVLAQQVWESSAIRSAIN